MCPCGSASSAAVGSWTTPVSTSTWGHASRGCWPPRSTAPGAAPWSLVTDWCMELEAAAAVGDADLARDGLAAMAPYADRISVAGAAACSVPSAGTSRSAPPRSVTGPPRRSTPPRPATRRPGGAGHAYAAWLDGEREVWASDCRWSLLALAHEHLGRSDPTPPSLVIDVQNGVVGGGPRPRCRGRQRRHPRRQGPGRRRAGRLGAAQQRATCRGSDGWQYVPELHQARGRAGGAQAVRRLVRGHRPGGRAGRARRRAAGRRRCADRRVHPLDDPRRLHPRLRRDAGR